MDFLIEFIVEFVLEGSIEIVSNRKISKWVRYPLAFFIVSFFLFILGIMIVCAVMIFPTHKWLSIFLFLVALILVIGIICKAKKMYNRK